MISLRVRSRYLEKGAEEEGQVLNEVLLLVRPLPVSLLLTDKKSQLGTGTYFRLRDVSRRYRPGRTDSE